MNRQQILIGFVLRAFLWGVGLGLIVGFVVQVVFLGPVSYGLFGFVIGGVMGAVLGIVNGVVLAWVTLRFKDVLEDSEKYMNAVSTIASLMTFAASGVIFFVVVYVLFNLVVFALGIVCIAAIFASLSAYSASHQVAGWYRKALASA